MSRALLLLVITAGLALSGCDKAKQAVTGDPQTLALNAAVESRLGGTGACVVLADTASGEIRYQYGRAAVCMRQLPPCSTFKVANSLIGIDAGLVTPQTVFKWDGSPQPVSRWERDTDMTTAFRESIVWWYQRLARQVGAERYAERLRAFGYGNADVSGAVDRFWLGLQGGGALVISTREQADFLHRFYTGALPVKPQTAAAVEAMMVDEARGGVEVSGKTGTCATSSDGAREVGWGVGRLKGPQRDLVFAASMEGDDALPGLEVLNRMKAVFAEVGYLPAE